MYLLIQVLIIFTQMETGFYILAMQNQTYARVFAALTA